MSKKAKLRLIVYIATSVLTAIAVLLLVTIVNLFVIFSTPDKLKGDFTVTFDDTNELTKPYLIQSVGVNTLHKNGIWYVDFNEIANIYGFSVSGDRSHLRYVFRNDLDDMMYLDFEKDTLELNNVSLACDLLELGSDGRVYLPVEIINNYFEGIDISYDVEEKTFLVVCEEICFLSVRDTDTTPKIDKTQIP